MVMAAAPTKLRFLDPTSAPVVEATPMAPRVATLDGLRVGMLGNSKKGAKEFLDELSKLLDERFRGITFVRSRKGDATSVCPPEVLSELVNKSDVVITAIGD